MRYVRVPVLALAAVLLPLSACERAADEDLQLLDDDEQHQSFVPSTMSCDIPAPPPGERTVQVVFSCDEQPVGTWRAVPGTAQDTLAFALEALLSGPTAAERASGLSSFFSHQTAGMLNGAAVRDGVAYVDFRDFSGIVPNASTSAGSAELLDQIAGTIFQFDGIREAELSFDGSCDAFWNWIQRGCERLARDEPHE
jgi:hypothetical protein